MKSLSKSAALAPLAAALLLAGCGSSVKLSDTPVETRNPQPVATSSAQPTPGATSSAAPQSQVATVDLTKKATPTAADNLARIFYFDFDSFVIKDEFKPLVEGHAKRMLGAPSKRYTIEGHTDERGGREYNLALGQKRAEAVVKSLALLGANQSTIEAVSFGEERPAAPGSDETAWSRNRRAELKDR